MRPKRRPTIVKKPNLANPTTLPNAAWPGEKETWETVALVLAAKPARKERVTAGAEVPTDYLKTLVSIATNAWRAKTKMVDGNTGEVDRRWDGDERIHNRRPDGRRHAGCGRF